MESLLQSRERFEMFGASHQAVVVLSLLLALVLVRLGRSGRGLSVHRWLPRALGVLIVVSELVFVTYPLYLGNFAASWGLPLQLCDLTALVAGLGLITLDAFALEVGFFLGLSATMLTTLTPDLAHDFPHVEFLCFFLTHALVSVAMLYVAFGLDRRPRPGAALKVWLAVNLYGLVAAEINIVLGSNYLYICRKPPMASPFDWMGPWPWYVVAVDLTLCAILLALAALAARVPDARTSAQGSGDGPDVAADRNFENNR